MRPLLERVAAGYPGARITIDASVAGPEAGPAARPEAGMALANPETLEQVLRHLIQNALDASAPDRTVQLRVAEVGYEAVIEVIDFGCGMGAEFMRTGLFKPFVSTKPGGFGIGAFESRELVQAMRGRLEVESREGMGSRFVVRLPLARTDGLSANYTRPGTMADEERPLAEAGLLTHRKVA